MPFVQINLAQNLTDEVKKNISSSIHESLVDVFKIPQDDFFQVIHEVRPSDLLWPDSYMNIPHTGNMVLHNTFNKSSCHRTLSSAVIC